MEWLDDQRTRKARNRPHQQGAVCWPAGLEPAALRQRPEPWAAGVAHERGIGVDRRRGSGTEDCRRWTLAGGESASERNFRQVCQWINPENNAFGRRKPFSRVDYAPRIASRALAYMSVLSLS